MLNPRWLKFERLVAAIQRTDAPLALVEWNSRIAGRQFDVVLRFAVGSHSYLTVFECKDQARPVPVGDIEAFVIKARDAGASKAVIVSSSGFQSGAFDVARRHHIELFTLSYLDEVPEELLSADLIPTVRVFDLRLGLAGSVDWEALPEDRGLPAYLERNVTLRSPISAETLLDFINRIFIEAGLKPKPVEQEYTTALSPTREAYIPHQRYTRVVDRVQFKYRYDSLRALKQPGVDPTLVSGTFEYRDILSGKVTSFPRYTIQLDHDTLFVPGSFYFNPALEYSYYCERIDGDQVRLFLVESYQHGNLVQGVLRARVSVQRHYVEITDPVEVSRLRRVAEKIFRHHGVV